MSMAMFGLVDRALAERETRVLIFLPGNEHGVPPDEYGLVEMYCDERECDCRRVMIAVYSRHPVRQVATINHAFDPPAAGDSMPQTFLDRLNSQSQLSEAFLREFLDLVRHDADYVARLERHYRMFKEFIGGGRGTAWRAGHGRRQGRERRR